MTQRTRPQQRRSPRRGMSLMEVMVTVTIFGIVVGAVAFLESATAKQVLALYGDARTLHRAHLTLERIRYKLCMGQVKTVVISEPGPLTGRSIRFRNPNLPAGQISGFRFYNKSLYYYENVATMASTPGQGIMQVEDVVFQCDNQYDDRPSTVGIAVKTLQKVSWRLGRPYTLRAEVTLRN